MFVSLKEPNADASFTITECTPICLWHTLQIRIAKATMKRFKTVGGRHPREYAKASARLEKLRKKMDRFETYHAAELTEDTCVAAFVVFNCEDSQRYCLEDYARSGSWWGRKTQVRLSGCE